ncbi:MAG: hypothetical protein P1V97_12060, partial [Planctomycetota bacterium]|nr:hypothetical protein [Planctomycetota bacterium]
RVRRQKSQLEELEEDLTRIRRRNQELEVDIEGYERRISSAKAQEEEFKTLQAKVISFKEIEADGSRSKERISQLESDLVEAREKAGKLKDAEDEIQRLRMEIVEAKTAHQESSKGMLDEVKKMLQANPQQAAAPSGEFADQLSKMQEALSGQLRRMTLSGGGGGGATRPDGNVDLSQLFNVGGGKSIESNIDQIEVKSTKAGSVRNKLNRLKKLRGGG